METTIYELKEITPTLPGEPSKSDRRITLSLDENQLWFVYLGLSRLDLVKKLKVSTDKLAREIKMIGVSEYKWV